MSSRLLALGAYGVALLTGAASSGCYSWQVQPVTPKEYVVAHPGKPLRIDRSSGETAVFDSATIANISLIGFSGRTSTTIPLEQVKTVAISRFAGGKTGAVVGAVVALGAGFLIVGRATTNVVGYQ